MENDLIRRSDAVDMFKRLSYDDWNQGAGTTWANAFSECEELINMLPAVDAVERAVYEQVAWERDIAVKQLADIGKSLGAKMDDVTKVVRCRECIYYKESRVLSPMKFCFRLKDRDGEPIGYNWAEDEFCSRGQRREDGDA